MQLVKAENLILGHIETSLGHEAQASLRSSRFVFAEVVNVRLGVGDLVVSDVAIALLAFKNTVVTACCEQNKPKLE